jgi:geranylgeranyl diphosphate synthase type I
MLLGLLGRSDLTAADIERAQRVINSTGAASEVEAMISTRVRDALAALDGVTLDPTGREALVTLAGAASYRHE